jgi:2-hydroxy-3-oxopropionate reductase
MTRVSVVGLGVMGSPMAVRLARAGHEVIGFNRTPSKASALVDAGGRAASSLAEAVSGAEIVLTVLPDTPDVRSVLLGDRGVLAHLEPGSLCVDLSTIAPAAARELAAAATEQGIGMLDAPVSGGERGAIDGTLSIMVGGEAADLDRAKPVLEVLGRTIVHVGPHGAGQLTKAANQLVVAGNIALVAEAMVFLRANGVDPGRALEVLGGGLAGSRVLDQKGPAMLERRFEPGFRLSLHHKDLGIAAEAARSAQVVTPLGAMAAQLVASAVARGLGDLDHAALVCVIETLSGLADRSSPPRGPEEPQASIG